jgi:hypothetical protein
VNLSRVNDFLIVFFAVRGGRVDFSDDRLHEWGTRDQIEQGEGASLIKN